MKDFRAWLGNYIPTAALDIVIFAIILFGAIIFVTQNVKVLRIAGNILQKVGVIVNKLLGRRMQVINKRVLRSAYLNKDSLQYTIVKYFEDIIMNLELQKEGITVTGLLFFMLLSSFIATIFLDYLLKFGTLLPFCFATVFFLVFTLFRLYALTRVEKREAMIMDAIDLLVSDVKGGIFNAMMRHQESFNPVIRPYFIECVDNVRHKNFSVSAAVLELNKNLGVTFTDFAYKVIIYEEKGGESMENLFSSIIELNRNRRQLRYINDIKFNSLKNTFLITMLLIGSFAAFLMLTEPFVYTFFTENFGGRLMLIADVAAIGAVLAFITSIKAKSY